MIADIWVALDMLQILLRFAKIKGNFGTVRVKMSGIYDKEGNTTAKYYGRIPYECIYFSLFYEHFGSS